MTGLPFFGAFLGDPIHKKPRQLSTPQIDNWPPDRPPDDTPDKLQPLLSYIDVMALMRAHGAKRQSAMFAAMLSVRPSDPQQKPFKASVRTTYGDFFPMFDVPFKYGRAWTASEDENRSAVVVLTREMNERLFGGANSVGKTIRLDSEPYTRTGDLDDWQVLPRFYDLQIQPFGKADEIFLPFTRAIEKQVKALG